ncbi:MAG: hypothetical protein ACRDQW_00860 [Haloechinothrix sp.]
MASLVVCCALAWWQWGRFSSASGSFQNLGYVLQWPLFGLFPAFLFWRMHRLEQQAELAGESTGAVERAARPPRVVATTPSAVDDDDDDDDDDELAAYNRFLAELNARDQQAG